MAYDTQLADRIHAILDGRPGLIAKKMFGGIGFILNGNVAVGVLKDGLLVRVAPDRTEELMSRPHVGLFEMTGRPMQGWVVVRPPGVAVEVDLETWVERGFEHAATLPPK